MTNRTSQQCGYSSKGKNTKLEDSIGKGRESYSSICRYLVKGLKEFVQLLSLGRVFGQFLKSIVIF